MEVEVELGEALLLPLHRLHLVHRVLLHCNRRLPSLPSSAPPSQAVGPPKARSLPALKLWRSWSRFFSIVPRFSSSGLLSTRIQGQDRRGEREVETGVGGRWRW